MATLLKLNGDSVTIRGVGNIGGGCSRALNVGNFNANGLWATQDAPGAVGSSLGCAAVWNFGNWDLES